MAKNENILIAKGIIRKSSLAHIMNFMINVEEFIMLSIRAKCFS